jgi:hypothetical protein
MVESRDGLAPDGTLGDHERRAALAKLRRLAGDGRERRQRASLRD